MPDLLDRIYCSEQIHIPPTFPYIMKLYCKAAIRTQPYDLLKWSAAYFRALANGEEPPAKERVEYPPYDSPTGLTPGYIKILINQFGKDPSTMVTAQSLFQKWSGICLQEHVLIKLLALLGAKTTVNWVQFVGICAGFISKTLTQTMILICELFTEEPEGGMATIPYELFIDLYIFLGEMECGPLTEAEKEEMDGIMKEEDICEVADKIKEGYYGEGEGEGEGEEAYIYGEEGGEERGGEGILEEETEEDTIKMGEELPSRKESEVESAIGEFEGKEEVEDDQNEGETSDKDERQEDDVGLSESSFKEGSGERSMLSKEGEGISTRIQSAEEIFPETEEKTEAEEPKEEEEIGEEEEEEEEEVEKQKPKKIDLEDLEESIREKIKKKLEEDEENQIDEGEREFEDLNSYLLGTATRVHKYTADILGFKIFKKYMRQDVPGIGPRIENEQVQKVVEFFDFWSHKQEMMVMPRNIRHWMCPPLDKIPTNEP